MHDSRSDFVSGTTFSIQLWTIRRQKSYVFGDLFTFVPASTVENQNAVVSRSYGSTGEMFVHGCRVGVADREHPFCACGSEKIDVAVAMVQATRGRSFLRAHSRASIPANSALVLEPGRSPGLVGPYRIFHNVLKILMEFLLILGLRLGMKWTRRNVTEAQPLPDVFLPWNT